MPYFVHDGHRLFYREQGAGRLLLILPGNTSASAHLGGELEYFAARYHTAALDFWGTGGSDRLEIWPADWWEQGARDALALVEHLGYERCLAMGTSGGAVIALLTAILSPERVQAVLADSCVERLSAEELRAAVAGRARRSPEQVAFWRCAHGDDWEQVVDADSALMLHLAERGGDWFGGRLGQIRCPVLFTASLRDEAFSDAGERVCAMVKQIPGSQAFLTGEGGHPLMWSRPEEFRRAAGCFLSAHCA